MKDDLSGGAALLVGSSYSALPLLHVLKSYGLKVSVCGIYHDDPCHYYADESYYIDYSKTDQFESLINSNKFDYIIPTCNDYSYISCAKVAEYHNFPGFDPIETTYKIHKKNQYRYELRRLGLPTPWFSINESDSEILNLTIQNPMLIKPVDSFSGRGITKVYNRYMVKEAIKKATKESRSGNIIIEQYIDGTLHSHSAFLIQGSVFLDYFVDEFCTIYPYQVNCSNHPSRLPEAARIKVRAAIEEFARALGLVDGLLHTQFLFDGENIWLIESMRRCPGDLYGELIGLSTGCDYANLFVRPFLGLSLNEERLLSNATEKYWARHTVSIKEQKIYKKISFAFNAKQVHIYPLKTSGEILQAAPNDKAGIIFAEFETFDDMIKYTPLLADLVRINEYQ